MRQISLTVAALAFAVSGGAALAQSAHQNRLSGPENPANARAAATATTATTGAQSAHQNPLNGPENPANARPGSPSKKLPESKR